MGDNQPTILVKKSDGTTERITLAEFQTRQRNQSTPLAASAPVALPATPPVSSMPPSSLSAPAPRPKINLPKQPAPPKPEMTKEDFKSPLEFEDELPMVVRPQPAPATAAPFNPFVHGGKLDRGSLLVARNDKPRGGEPAKNIAPIAPLKLNSQPATKIFVNDIKAKPITMSPVDEIASFTLVDFRRLAADTAEAASRLRQKFENLKDESYLLYLEAIAGWKKSPLYLDYLKKIGESLALRKPIAANADKNIIQPAELSVLINMNKTLV